MSLSLDRSNRERASFTNLQRIDPSVRWAATLPPDQFESDQNRNSVPSSHTMAPSRTTCSSETATGPARLPPPLPHRNSHHLCRRRRRRRRDCPGRCAWSLPTHHPDRRGVGLSQPCDHVHIRYRDAQVAAARGGGAALRGEARRCSAVSVGHFEPPLAQQRGEPPPPPPAAATTTAAAAAAGAATTTARRHRHCCHLHPTSSPPQPYHLTTTTALPPPPPCSPPRRTT